VLILSEIKIEIFWKDQDRIGLRKSGQPDAEVTAFNPSHGRCAAGERGRDRGGQRNQ